MNIKYLLPLFAATLLVACSDDESSPTQASDAVVTVSSSSEGALLPPELSSSDVPPAGDVSSSSAPAPAVNESSSSAPAIQTTDENGKLIARDPTKEYTFYGSELTGKEQFMYGRFEARMKMASISGTVSSMFLNYDNSYKKGEEPWNEIDIEVLGKSQTQWQSNIITREADPSISGTTNSESMHDFGFDATADFHLYTIVWTPEYVAWEIDSVEIRRDTLGMTHGTHADADQVKFLTQPQSLRFNLWASKTPAWTGEFTGIGLPIEQQIDYVRAYTYDTTTKAFTLSWQDDFEGTSLDTKRWSRGNWVMENVQYRTQNVKVSDGMARIILDYEVD